MSVSPVSSDAAIHWAMAPDQVAEHLAARFVRAEPRRRALAYLKGLLSPAQRKNGW
jgi:hypothetical protein